MTPLRRKLSEIGEKALIREFIKPLFNSTDDPAGVGDDCAMVSFHDDLALFSTDRVPSDLTALRLGILDHYRLGDYLARLNLSDIAACGGEPLGMLLNLGLPADIAYDDVKAICRGFGSCAERHGATVLGGDITSASEISLSATSIGRVDKNRVLTRRGARPGDSVFISRPLGITPAAFCVFLGDLEAQVGPDDLTLLTRQFTDMQPMFELGQSLSASGVCGACMDNTDGIGQSLSELSEASKCALIIRRSDVHIPGIVERVSSLLGVQPSEMVFNSGADFSLVGTIRGSWSAENASREFGHKLEIIGRVEEGQGVWLEDNDQRPLAFRGWNYFTAPTNEFDDTLKE